MTHKVTQWMRHCLSRFLFCSILFMHMVYCDSHQTSQCDCVQFESTFGKEYGVFMSPDWPTPYEHQKGCLLYIFQAPSNHIVELTFDEFDLQRREDGCDYSDHVRLFLHLSKPGLKSSDVWNTLLCGSYNEIESTYYSSSSILSFQFHTTSHPSNATGFRGTFRFLHKALFRTDGQLMTNTQCDYVFRHDILARAHGQSSEENANNRLTRPVMNGLNRRIHSTESIWEFDDDDDLEKMRIIRDQRQNRRNVRSFFLNSLPYKYSSSTSLIRSPEKTFGPGTSVSAKGHFYSPQYPSTYPRYSRCLYRFQAKQGEKVYLHFTDINLHRIDESCHTSLDIVNVYDGINTNSPLIGQLCGTNYFVELTSTGPEVLVEFVSQGYISAKGFRAEFAFISTTVPSSPPIDFWQHFSGLDNAAGLANNRTKAPPLSSTSSSSSLFESIPGQMIPIEKTTNKAPVSSSPGTGGASCDFWFSSDTHSNGTFTSPRYPSPYPENIICRYHFVGGGKQRVQIVFRHFDVHHPDENAQNCEFSDSLTAWVYTKGQQEKIDSFCGKELPPKIMSNGARLTLEFNAKSKAWHREQRRRKPVYHHHQQYRSSGEYGAYSQNKPSSQRQQAQSREDNHVSSLKRTNDISTESSVAAYQRFTHQLQKAQRLKHHQQNSASGSTDFDVEFTLNDTDDQTQNSRGFEASYQFVTDFGIGNGKQDSKSVCGFVFNSSDASTGTFSSPNYPGLYPKDTECHYFFYGSPTEQVHIQFHHFDVEGVVPCTIETASDYLEFSSVHSSDRKPTRVCGVKHLPVIVSEGDFFRVTFKSNSRFDATGFQAVYAFRPRLEDNSLQLKKARSSLTTMIGSMSQAPETKLKNPLSTPNPPQSTSSIAKQISYYISIFLIIIHLML